MAYSAQPPVTRAVLLCSLLVIASAGAVARQNRIDVVTPAAPELAAYGPHHIGVRTIEATDRNRPDVLNTKEGETTVRADRTLTLEVWYPATLRSGQQDGGEYRTLTRDPAISAAIRGRAVRDASAEAGTAFPLIIISHGYPGNRYLLSHLGENLASKGFVTVSIAVDFSQTASVTHALERRDRTGLVSDEEMMLTGGLGPAGTDPLSKHLLACRMFEPNGMGFTQPLPSGSYTLASRIVLLSGVVREERVAFEVK